MRLNVKGISLGVFVLLIMLLCNASSYSAERKATPWTAYFGSQDRAAVWAYSVRGIGRGHTGLALRSTLKSPGGDEVSQLAMVEKTVRSLISNHQFIIPVGGLGSGRSEEKVNTFMTMIEKDGASAWKNIVKSQASRFALLAESQERLYWQIGNEINSKRFNENLRRWGAKPARRSRNDDFVIPFYAEYFLAPTVEAIDAASRHVYGSEGKIRIVLGTIANARGKGARTWLKSLLEYEIRGTFAKSLTGKRVYDLVDVVAIHYLVTAEKDRWLDMLDALRATWVGRGRIRAIWSTEELGRRRTKQGLGAATAIKVASRYLYWWGERAMTPTEGRCFFWGWNLGRPGTKGDDGLRVLYQFLGDAPLKALGDGVTLFPKAKLESYGFENEVGNKRVVTIFPMPSETTEPIEHLVMRGRSWTGNIASNMHIFSPKGHATLPLTTRLDKDVYTVMIPQGFVLEPGSAAMIFLERKN
jgi:hypothetical protein